ncbi:hypothetical protein FRC01_004358 [Tulasnella sp. 417]|nr:hypothetical protein FRC01_004358 [Tulasnella sp. 417]
MTHVQWNPAAPLSPLSIRQKPQGGPDAAAAAPTPMLGACGSMTARDSVLGNKYYWQERLKVVSLGDPNQADYDTVFQHAKNILVDLARTQNADIQDAETFFSVARVDENAIDVDYYMIDHDKRVPFWLHAANVDQELLGIPPYESKEHLGKYLAVMCTVEVANLPMRA